jgi:hypothetical protein
VVRVLPSPRNPVADTVDPVEAGRPGNCLGFEPQQKRIRGVELEAQRVRR